MQLLSGTIALIFVPLLSVCAQPETTASLAGVVMDAETGAPVPRVHVTLRDPADSAADLYGAITKEDGTFSIAGIKAGTYSIAGERAGFVTARGTETASRVTLRSDARISDFTLKLIPTGAISGQIADADGKPVEGAEVIVESGTRRRQTGTDETGRFRIGGLAPGKYFVRASHESSMGMRYSPPEIRTDGTVDIHNAATYYPGALTAKQARPVEVRQGDEAKSTDIRLIGVPIVRVSGKVLGMPRNAQQTYVTVGSRGSGYGIPLNPDGSFEIWGLDPGGYTLNASPMRMGDDSVSTGVIRIEVGSSNIDNLELRMLPASDIAGRIEGEVQSGLATTQRMVTYRLLGAGPRQVSRSPVGEDGTFRLERLPPGKYVMGVSWNEAYVNSMRLGAATIEGATLDVSDGAGGDDLTLILAAATGVITGITHDDQGAATDARVLLIGDDASNVYREAKAGGDGVFTFRNVPRGSYRAVALRAEDQDFNVQDVSVFADVDGTERIELGDSDTVSRDLKIVDPDDLPPPSQ